MRFLILRILTHSELGMFHEYRRQKNVQSIDCLVTPLAAKLADAECTD